MSNDPRLKKLQASLVEMPYTGQVSSLCLRKDDGVREHPDSIDIDIKNGVIGDRWIWRTWKHLENGDSDPRVQVAVCNSRILELLQTEKANAYHPGDNIMVDYDLSAKEFSEGGRFQLGGVILEVTDVYNDACAKFAGEFGNDVLKWINLPQHRKLNLRGIYCRVIQSGTISMKDSLQVL
jgi:hypothetical protein